MLTPKDVQRALDLAELGPGTIVTYWTTRTPKGLEGASIRTTTASRPRVMGDGSILVNLSAGPRGGVCVSHLRLQGEDD